MQEVNSNLIHPLEIYLSHLTKINGFFLTPREIDVISCLLNGRNRKGIGNFLSISPKTVDTHINKVAHKFGCNSDSMMTLLMDSDKFYTLKEYYLALLTESLFKKSLKEIAKFDGTKSALSCVLVYWHKKPPFLEKIAEDLRAAGLSLSVEERKDAQPFDQLLQEIYHDTCPVYFLPDMVTKEQETQLISQETEQSSDIKFFFLSKAGSPHPPQEISQFACVNDSVRPSYYFSIVAILKKLRPELALEAIFEKFEEKANALYGPPFSLMSQSSVEDLVGIVERENQSSSIAKVLTIKKTGYAITAIAFSSILSMGFLFPWIWNLHQMKRHEENRNQTVYSNHSTAQVNRAIQPIRSDLIIPTESTLLNRSELIAKIDNHFQKQSQSIQTIALIGIGGAGKTTLACHYARSQKSPVIWEINAQTQETLRNSFDNLAYALAKTDEEKKTLRELKDIKDPIERENKISQLIKELLRSQPSWLLIYDNVEQFGDIQKHLPSDPNVWGTGKVILTTRNNHIQPNVSLAIQIGELKPSEKLSLFLKIMGNRPMSSLRPTEVTPLEKFLDHIPPFPLDVSTAAYYLKATAISCDEYLARLKHNNGNFVALQENVIKGSMEYNKTRHSIIALSLNDLIDKNKDFVGLLLFISLVDSQNIPRMLLDSYINENTVDEFIYNLQKYSLISTGSAPSSFSLHRHIHKICLDYLLENLSLTKRNKLLESITRIMENHLVDIILEENYENMKLLINHYDQYLKHHNLLNDSMKSSLGAEICFVYLYFGRYQEALYILEGSLVKLRKIYPEKYERFASGLVHSGIYYREIGNYDKAEQLLSQSIGIYRKHSKNHVGSARALTYLSSIYQERGNLEKAKNTLEESLEIYKRSSKGELGLAWTLGKLGNVYKELGFYKKAITLLENGHTIYKQHSENHIGVARTLVYLGTVFGTLGDYGKAKKLIESSFPIYKKTISDDHVEIAWALAHAGWIERELGNNEKSRDILTKSLLIYKKHFPDDHVEIAWALDQLGKVYKNLGNREKATECLTQSCNIYEKKHGKHNNNPTTHRLRGR